MSQGQQNPLPHHNRLIYGRRRVRDLDFLTVRFSQKQFWSQVVRSSQDRRPFDGKSPPPHALGSPERGLGQRHGLRSLTQANREEQQPIRRQDRHSFPSGIRHYSGSGFDRRRLGLRTVRPDSPGRESGWSCVAPGRVWRLQKKTERRLPWKRPWVPLTPR